MTSIKPAPRNFPRSIGAVLAGIAVVFVLSLGTDAILHATGAFPGWGKPMGDGLFAVATAYRIVFGIIGGFVTAALAPGKRMKHALIMGTVGLVFSILGAAATWNKGPEFGPKWYPLSLVITALPCAWLGARLRGETDA